MSLRARLLLAVIVLAAAGLLVADVVTYTFLNSFLTARTDQQLVDNAGPTAHYLSEEEPSEFPPRRTPLPPGTYAALLDDKGAVTTQVTFGFTSAEQASKPQLPPNVPAPSDSRPVRLTLWDSSHSTTYRAVVVKTHDAPNPVLLAIPLTEVQSTLQRLLVLEIGVGVTVLAGLAALSAWAVRLGLRPLDSIAETAGHIADGDLRQRVQPATSRTEIGRLGLALNAMLAEIEDAFAARRASEDRLRRFVSDASHELRTPVASIRGYAELFRRGASQNPADLAMAMRRIEDEAGRMGHLVDDLLLLARLDEGRPLEQTPVDLSQLALDAAADARATDPHRTIQATVDEDAIVVGDELRLRQVITNLVRNALIHTPAGTPIELAARLDDGSAVLEVVDHGPGIPAEVADHIFERFYRADPARGHDAGSSGLGLSIAAAIVAAHGGSVDVRTTPGSGATFSVRLPRYVASHGPRLTTPRAEHNPASVT